MIAVADANNAMYANTNGEIVHNFGRIWLLVVALVTIADQTESIDAITIQRNSVPKIVLIAIG